MVTSSPDHPQPGRVRPKAPLATLTAEFLIFPHLPALPPGSPFSRSSTSHPAGDITDLSFLIPPVPIQSCELSRFSLVPLVSR